MTQLLVIDTKTNMAKAFDGRVLIDTVHIGIDEDTTREGLMEAIEDVRAISTVQLKEARRQMDLLEAQMKAAIRYSPKGVVDVKVTFNHLKPVVQ